MLHRTAKLKPFGRRLLVHRVLMQGRPAATAAEMLGVSRATAYKWLRRYRTEGLAGLEDRSARPHRRPRALPDREVRRILLARRRLRVGPHRLGPLLGHDYLHVAIDDATRVAYVAVRPDEQAGSTVSFVEEAVAFFAGQGVRVERVMTDNAWTYTHSTSLAALFADLRIRHVRTRPRGPQTIGRVERFIGTIQREWAYARLFLSNERLATLPGWVDAYNRRRPPRRARWPDTAIGPRQHGRGERHLGPSAR